MNVLQRTKDLLLRPRATWPAIAAEPGDIAAVYRPYVLVLAAIPALAGFVGLSLVGFGGGFRLPLVSGVVHTLVSYVMTLAMVFVFALAVDRLAPTFGGTKHPTNAVKLVACSLSAGWVGGVFLAVPPLAPLSLIAWLYSIFLFHTGVPVLMKCPKHKALPYTAAAGLVGLVLAIALSRLVALALPVRLGMVATGSA